MKRGAALIFLLVLGATLLWGAMWAYRQLAQDRCLDRGGKWQHAVSTCELPRAAPQAAAWPLRELAKYISTSPLPLASNLPRYSQLNSRRTRS